MTSKPALKTHARSGIALFLATLTILIALVTLAAGQSPFPGNRAHAGGVPADGAQSSTPLLVRAVTYLSSGKETFSVAVADVNGDGIPDLISASYCNVQCHTTDGWVSVLLGNGNGKFQTAVGYTSGGDYGTAVAVADLNGDGKPDLVVTNLCDRSNGCTTGLVAVLLGNGNGTFQAAVGTSSGGSTPNSIAVADVNGDGKPDLVVANKGSNSVAVLFGNGDGTFQAAVPYDSGGDLPISAAIADVNRDGKPDLVVTNTCISASSCPGFGSVGVLLGNGNGTFQSALTYDPGAYTLQGLAVADVNGDGKPDLVVALSSGTVRVLLGNGDGTFQPAVAVETAVDSTSVAVADINGDGKPDLVVSGSNSTNVSIVGVLLGNGDGTFQPISTYKSGGAGVLSVVVQDLNSDSKPDVVVVNINPVAGPSSLGVLLNNTGVATQMVVTTSGSPSFAGQPVTFTATVAPTLGTIPDGELATFKSGTTTLASVALANGKAVYTTSSLSAKTYAIKATYPGDVHFKPSSGTVTQVVDLASTTTALTSSVNPSTHGQAVTFTVTVTSSGPNPPTGKVAFKDGTTGIGTAVLSGGVATLTKSTLAVGTHSITGEYLGDASSAKSTSAVLSQVVN
jgi:hypothetical protein